MEDDGSRWSSLGLIGERKHLVTALLSAYPSPSLLQVTFQRPNNGADTCGVRC